MKENKKGYIRIILNKIFNFIYVITILICILLIFIIFMQKITDSNKSFYGYRLFRVVSGSMIPKYDIGEVVLCKETNVNDIKIGDDIVYKGIFGELENKIIMHEVVSINKDKDGKTVISAKGITNNQIDPDIRENQVYGTVKYKSLLLTILYSLATKKETSFIIIMILVINVFLSFKSENKEKILEEMRFEKEKEERKKKKREKKLNDKENHKKIKKQNNNNLNIIKEEDKKTNKIKNNDEKDISDEEKS